MSEISEIEIKSMTKEQNYMRGYENGKSDVLDMIRAEMDGLLNDEDSNMYAHGVMDCLEIIDKYIEGSGEE